VTEITNSFYGIDGIDRLTSGDPDTSNGSKKNPWKARHYQNEIYKILNKHSKITCVTGGGKSFMILGKAYLEAKQFQKQIICIPKKIIGNGFVINQWVKFSRNKINFNIKHDLCVDDSAAELNSKANELISFIKKSPKKIGPVFNEYIYLVTHATFARSFNKLKKDKKLNYYFKNITVHIDEAHRVHLEDDEKDNEKICNQLGKAIKYIIKNSERKKIYFNLVTATFYRNKRENIVPIDFKWTKQNTINVNTITFLEHCKYLTGFNYSLRLEEGEYTEGIKKIFDNDPSKPTLIFMPTDGSKDSIWGMTKLKAVEEIKRVIGGNLKIKSLVDERQRKRVMEEIREENDIDVIINIRVASEGFDWPECKRVIICGKRNSLIEIPQNIGRVMRDHESKKHEAPEVIHILPKVDPEADDDGTLKGIFNNVMKLIGGQLLLISDLYSKEANKLNKIAGKKQTINEYLGENLTVDERENFDQTIRNRMIDLLQIKGQDNVSDDDVKEIIREELNERNLDDSSVMVNFLLRQKKMETIHSIDKDDSQHNNFKKIEKHYNRLLNENNVDNAEIDLLLDEVDSFGWIKNYTTKIFNVQTFRELEERLDNTIIEKIIAIRDYELKKLEEEND